MLEIETLREKFDNNKKAVIEVISGYYDGYQVQNIADKINSTYYEFSSTPEEDYKYIKNNRGMFNSGYILKNIRLKCIYLDYKEITKRMEKLFYNELQEIAKEVFKINNLSIESSYSKIAFSAMFSHNMDSAAIDAFSTQNINILNNSETDEKAKEQIKLLQELFKKEQASLGIEIENLSKEAVDIFIKKRDELIKKYRYHIIKNTVFGSNIFDRMEKELKTIIPQKTIANCLLEKGVCNHITYHLDTDIPGDFHSIITVPVIQLINSKYKSLDVDVIHESIHQAEASNKFIGIKINDAKKTNNIINEVRTQMIAIKLTHEMHKNGIFIFDDPDDYIVEGESKYEALFPLIKPFIEENEDIFKYCAISNDPYKLAINFGINEWLEFSRLIDRVFNNYNQVSKMIGSNPIQSTRAKKLIKSMNEYRAIR